MLIARVLPHGLANLVEGGLPLAGAPQRLGPLGLQAAVQRMQRDRPREQLARLGCIPLPLVKLAQRADNGVPPRIDPLRRLQRRQLGIAVPQIAID